MLHILAASFFIIIFRFLCLIGTFIIMAIEARVFYGLVRVIMSSPGNDMSVHIVVANNVQHGPFELQSVFWIVGPSTSVPIRDPCSFGFTVIFTVAHAGDSIGVIGVGFLEGWPLSRPKACQQDLLQLRGRHGRV